MSNIIKPKRSNVASKVPTTSDLTSGELGVNMADQKTYINNGTSVVQIGAGKLSGLADVSASSPTAGQNLSWNGSAWVPSSGGSGDVAGPSSSTDNALARFDGTTGKLIQNGTVTQDDNGNLAAVNAVTFNGSPANLPSTEGTLYWDSADGNKTLNLIMGGGAVTQQIGEEQYYRIKASSAITNGQVVMFTGTVGASGGLTGAPATGLTAATASYVMGIATQDIATNGWGYVTSFGLVRQINTSAFTDGAILYLDPSVAGGLTATIPSAPNPKVQVCACVYAAANGSLFVRPSIGGTFGMFEGDVQITTPADGNLLVRNQTSGKWVNAALSAGTGLAVTNGAGTVSVGAASGYSIPSTTSQTNWDSAYTQRLQWDGGSTNLVASTGRTSLGATTVGSNMFTLTNPSAITFPRFNADNTISALDAATFRTAIGAGTSSTTGTVTSITAGSYLTGGTITTSGTIAVDATSSNTASKVVARDASGNFSAGTITATLSGNATNISAYTINQNLGTGNQVIFDSVITGNNGNGTNFRIGDDVWIGDMNTANTFRVQGNQNAANGYIVFGNGDATALGRAGTGALTYGGNAVLTAGNYTSYSPSLTGSGASGTWGINVSGNAATASSTPNPTFSGDSADKDNITTRTDTGFYQTSTGTTAEGWPVDNNAWQHMIACTHSNDSNYYSMQIGGSFYDNVFYGRKTNGSGTTGWVQFITSGNIGSQSVNYASQVGINYNNDSNSTYQMLWGSGNSVYGTGGIYCNPATDYLYSGSFYCGNWFRSSGATGWYNESYGGGIYMQDTTYIRTYNSKQFYCDSTITAGGNVVANSDETLKTNWRDLPSDFVEQLAGVKHGTYDRIDIDLTQDGVSAQSLQKLLPNSVMTGAEGKLTVAYGNAAMVSSVQLAMRIVEQDKRISELEALVQKLVNKE